MTSKKILSLVLAALFAALCCVGTMLSIPTPNGGYIHPGDSMVLLSGIILGPLYGGVAAGIGSMFSDLFLGYVAYAPATLLIKALVAFVAGMLYKLLQNKANTSTSRSFVIVFCGIVGGIIVTGGYFLFESRLLGLGLGATASIPGNLIQNVFGIVLSTVLFPVLYKIPVVHTVIMEKKFGKKVSANM